MLVRSEGDGFFDVVLAANPAEDARHAETATGVGHHFFFGFVDVPGEVRDATAHFDKAVVHLGFGETRNQSFRIINAGGGTNGFPCSG